MTKLEKILCPVDFFPASLAAANYATALAAEYGATVHLLHVVTPMIRTAYEYSMNVADMTEAMERASRLEMTKLVTQLQNKYAKVESEVRSGEAREVIKQTIARLNPDLVAMGTHGRRGVERWVMGSVTEWTIRHSVAPVLTIASTKRPTEGQLRRIMVAIDFSDGTAEAVKYALSIADAHKSQVTLVHVVDPLTLEIPDRYRDILVGGVDKQLRDLFPSGVRNSRMVETKVKQGVPYRMILELLKTEKTDLLVMNIRGRGMIDRALLGSTAERVVRGAICPVILIPTQPKGKMGGKPVTKRAA